MKKKIIIAVFSLLILVTAIIFIVGAISSYNYDVKTLSGDIGDAKWIGFGAILTLMVGGFVVFYELDLFYTVYYFLIKPKTAIKSTLNILSNISLLLVIFTDYISHFLFKYVSDIFSEEIIVLFALFLIYVILRIVCVIISFSQSTKENSNL